MAPSNGRRLILVTLTKSSQSTRPSLHRTVPSRLFSSTPKTKSHIGSAPLSIPPNVSFELLNYTPPPPSSSPSLSTTSSSDRIPKSPKSKGPPPPSRNRSAAKPIAKVSGPLGELSLNLPAFLRIEHDEKARKAVISIEDRSVKVQRAMWGTTRAHLNNYLVGVSEGHSCILRLVGVGYRAMIEKSATTVSPEYDGQEFVSLKVGYSHPIELGIPRGVTASTPVPTRILLEGINKEVVKGFAAKIRQWRKPEPYKGKGIFVDDEKIILKDKKIK